MSEEMTHSRASVEVETMESDCAAICAHAQAIQSLVKVLEDSSLTEIDYRWRDLRIRVSRQRSHEGTGTMVTMPMPMAASNASTGCGSGAPVPVQAAQAPVVEAGFPVTSPLVGTVYMAPKPGADPFVKVGDCVQEGQVLMIIEAMKVMNPIKSPRAGRIVAISAQNERPVEYGEELLRIE
jgi:acetyl-CoA carboxylase biotin carboxyl carrier protein